MRFHLNILFIPILLTTAYPCFDFASTANQSYPSEPTVAAPTVVVVEQQSPNIVWGWLAGIILVWMAYLVALDRTRRHELELQINQIQRWQKEFREQYELDKKIANSQLSTISAELKEERQDSGAQNHLLRLEAQVRYLKMIRPQEVSEQDERIEE